MCVVIHTKMFFVDTLKGCSLILGDSNYVARVFLLLRLPQNQAAESRLSSKICMATMAYTRASQAATDATHVATKQPLVKHTRNVSARKSTPSSNYKKVHNTRIEKSEAPTSPRRKGVATPTAAKTRKPSLKKSLVLQRQRTDKYRTDKHEPPEKYYGQFKLSEPHIINKYLEIRTSPVPGKGRGIYTRLANIPAGTLLLEDKVLLHDPRSNSFDKNKGRFRKLVMALSPEDQQKFIALTCHDLPNTEESRFARNHFAEAGSTKASVWFWTSFLNHDCKPNCIGDSSGSGADEIISLRNVVPICERGTEITIDYMLWDIYNQEEYTVAKRRAKCLDHWSFECLCDTCKDAETTDAEFAELATLHRRIVFDVDEALKSSMSANRVVLDEDMDRFVYLLLEFRLIGLAYNMAKDASAFYEKLDDDLARGQATRWALEAVRIGCIRFGVEQLEADKDKTVVRDTHRQPAPEEVRR